MEQQRNQNIIGRNPVPLQRIGDFGVLARRRSRKHVQSKATRYRGVSDSSKHADLSLNSSSRDEEDEPSTSGRFGFLREAEVLHARWAMLGILGLIVPDILGQTLYLLPDLASRRLVPFTIQLLVAIGALEAYRGSQRSQSSDLDSRVYPGRLFDVFGVTQDRNFDVHKGFVKVVFHQHEPRVVVQETWRHGGGPVTSPGFQGMDPAAPGLGVYSSWLGGLPGWLSGAWWFEKREMTERQVSDMKRTELSSGRIAMVAFAGAYMASMLTGRGPITLLLDHVADPLNNSILHFLK